MGPVPFETAWKIYADSELGHPRQGSPLFFVGITVPLCLFLNV